MALPYWIRSIFWLAALAVSAAVLGMVILWLTVFLLVPWELTAPPAGTLAGAVNDFFNTNIKAMAGFVLLLEVAGLILVLLSRRASLNRVLRRFSLFNVAASLVSAVVAGVGMLLIGLIFPDWNGLQRDQNYNLLLIYWGMAVTGGVIAMLAYQTRRMLHPISRQSAI